jgi:hypothetical protein
MPFGAQSQELAEMCGLRDTKIACLGPGVLPPWLVGKPEVDVSLSHKFNKNVTFFSFSLAEVNLYPGGTILASNNRYKKM